MLFLTPSHVKALQAKQHTEAKQYIQLIIMCTASLANTNSLTAVKIAYKMPKPDFIKFF